MMMSDDINKINNSDGKPTESNSDVGKSSERDGAGPHESLNITLQKSAPCN